MLQYDLFFVYLELERLYRINAVSERTNEESTAEERAAGTNPTLYELSMPFLATFQELMKISLFRDAPNAVCTNRPFLSR